MSEQNYLVEALRPFVHAYNLHIRDDDADSSKPAIVQTGYYRQAAEALSRFEEEKGKPAGDDEVEAIRARHAKVEAEVTPHEFISDAHTDRATLLSRLSAVTAERDGLRERAEKAEKLVRTLLENDPMEYIADGGWTVFDQWRKDAARTLKGATDGR